MTIYQYGQLNTTALSTPGLYTIVVPPSVYLLNGVPTNIGAFVGTATWGPVGVPFNVSAVTDYSRTFGLPQARKYDMGTHLMAANYQGAAAVYKCVRVTDGTDTLATVNVGGAGASGTKAAGTVTYSVNMVNNQTLTLNGTIWTFVTAAPTTNYQVLIGATLAATLAQLVFQLNTSPDAQTSLCTYSATALILSIVFDVAGTDGNAFTLASSVGTASSTTLLGGTASTSGFTLNSIWTGSGGNGDTYSISTGTKIGTWKLVLTHTGNVPETFDNIGYGLSGAALWSAFVSAVNNGNSTIRPQSSCMVAVIGGSTAAPVVACGLLAGGTDGATTINGAVLIGVDVIPRKGMYALRSQAVSIAALCDCDDWTTYSTQIPFGLAEGIYMVGVTPFGDTPANAANVKLNAGIDSYAFLLMLGDWILVNDTINNLQRWISPQGYKVGWLANASPQFSSLNKPLQGIITTQKNQFGLTYSDADLQVLSTAGIDVITNPIPTGHMFGCRIGRNSSSNAVIHGDNYTRMTNYIAATINAGMGIFVGALQGSSPTDTTRLQAKATLDAFGQALITANMIVDWYTVLDLSNNPLNQIALGYMQAYVQVTYLSVVEYFLISLQGGQSVTITRSSSAPF